MQGFFLIVLFILGSCVGSFLCCEARRLHIKSTSKGKKLGPRSVCLSCKYQLKWYDNIPILSWIFLRGKCRKCGKKIGYAEILSELGLGLAFLSLGTTIDINSATPIEWAIFAVMLAFVIILGFLAVYDGIYGELPVIYLIISTICAIIILILKEWTILSSSPFSLETILSPLSSVAILGGIYFVLYLASSGKWVGDGDWILGTALGLALNSPWLALITLFIANVLACFVMAPIVKKSKNKHIHFGPFMIAAFIIVTTFADFFYYAIYA